MKQSAGNPQTPTSTASSAVPGVEPELNRIRALIQQRRCVEALGCAAALSMQAPACRDAMLLMALCQRLLERIPAALATLERLHRCHPQFGALYQERGHCWLALGDAARAREEFKRAAAINPALAESWRMLERLCVAAGDASGAAAAASQLSTLRRLPAAVVSAGSLFSDGQFSAAENLLRAHIADQGDSVEALRLLARIEHRRESLLEAERLLAAVLERSPKYLAARADYARVLIDRQKHAQALDHIDVLLRFDPRGSEYRALEAAACTGLGYHGRAMGIFRELLAAAPGSAELLVQMGHCAQVQGQREDAIGCYRAAAAARPAFGDAYWSLANLKTHHFSADDIAAMRAGESAPDASPHDRLHLCFALGKALEDWGDFAASWQYYERGNALKHATLRYRPEITEGNARRQMEVCTAGFFAARSGLGIPDPDPILIVGLPRSGSTLVEQILASHSQVEGAGELADIQRIVQGFDAEMPDPGNPRYPRALADMSRDDYVDLGRRYLAQTRAYRRGKPFFIDKMPNNFRHIGLIHLMMPNARIIDVRREPMACCVANFKQLYARGQEWSYSIGDVARYYRSYLKLMRHWDEVLPGRILRIHYEDLIGDLEGSVRRLLGFCALDFEQACVEFHATVRSVTTASSEQVRLPLYRTSLDHWRRFEPWLAPLAQALGG